MKIALVYDWVNKWGGAERLLLALHRIWPKAPLYTAVYNPQTASWAKNFKVIPSFLQKFPLAKTNHELYPWLMPLVFESFDFSGFDVVVSITSAEAKGIITKPSTYHVCYCLTPTRYLWSGYSQYFVNKIFSLLSNPLVRYLRFWDKVASWRPDHYLAISKNVEQRIKKYYGRDSEIIYPFVDTEKFRIQDSRAQAENYFLLVSRLVAYKKVNIAIKAFNQLGLSLKIVGIGKEMGTLRRLAKRNIEFLGELTDKELLGYYQKCSALIFPQEEDFGLVSLEAQACGKPIIAFRSGGALETVKEGVTGEFFYPQTVEALVKAVKNFKSLKFKPEDCRKNAERFSQEVFEKKWKQYLKKLVF